MTEFAQPTGHDEALLDRLFGPYEEIEAENAKRSRIYPQQQPAQIELTVRERTAAAIIRRVSRLTERYESD